MNSQHLLMLNLIQLAVTPHVACQAIDDELEGRSSIMPNCGQDSSMMIKWQSGNWNRGSLCYA